MADTFHAILLSIFALMLTTGSNSLSTEQISNKQPHVIFILADDLGWNDVSWNNPHVITPHMNKLASRGVILNQAYVQPTCTPTRASIMTGKYPFTMGLQKGVLKPTEPRGLPTRYKTLPGLLKKVGYSTHAIGKWHLGFCSWDYTPTKRGFDSFYGFYNGAQDHYTHMRETMTYPWMGGHKRKWRKNKRRIPYLDLRNNTAVDKSKKGIYSTELFATAAEEIIRSRNPKDPMFMYLAFQAVHSPLQVPLRYSKVYKHIRSPVRRVYLGMVTAMDEAIGRVVTALKETGHYENSVIIFTTDNGGSLGYGASNWPLRGAKAALWEGGTRGPAFIHSPHLPNPGTVYKQLHHITDWFPTILSIAGSDIPKTNGFNQWDAIAGISDSPREWMIYNMDDSKKFKAGVRFKNHKMLVGGMALTSWESRPTSKDSPLTSRTSLNQSLSIPSTDLPLRMNPLTDLPFTNNAVSQLPDREVYAVFNSNDTISQPLDREAYAVSNAVHWESNEPLSRSDSNYTENESIQSLLKAFTKKRKKDLDFIRWGKFKQNNELYWEPHVLAILERYLQSNTKIRLFNLEDDPEERNNLSETGTLQLHVMMNFLAKQLQNYKSAAIKRENPRGHPLHWDDIWTPGWCATKW